MYFRNDASMLVNTVVTDNALDGGSGFGAGICVDGGATPRLVHTTIARIRKPKNQAS